jgi:hypothetical protein
MYLATAWCIPTHNTLHGAPSCWTPYVKTCPGAVRKGQWRDVLLPAYLAGQNLEDDMPNTEAELVAAARKALITTLPGDFQAGSVTSIIKDIQSGVDRTEPTVNHIKDAVDSGVLVTFTPAQLNALAAALAPLVAARLEIQGIAEAVANELAQRLAQ